LILNLLMIVRTILQTKTKRISLRVKKDVEIPPIPKTNLIIIIIILEIQFALNCLEKGTNTLREKRPRQVLKKNGKRQLQKHINFTSSWRYWSKCEDWAADEFREIFSWRKVRCFKKGAKHRICLNWNLSISEGSWYN